MPVFGFSSDRSSRQRRGGLRLLPAALAVGVLVTGMASASTAQTRVTAASARPAVDTRPNIVLILTDDQRFDEIANMPNLQADVTDHGVQFSNAFVVNSECCPSRTTILTGKYSHGTDVYQNKPPHGGFQTFEPEEGTTIATQLQTAGYRTGLVGKYLNGYDNTQVSHVPAGWDRWVALTFGNADGNSNGYYDYTLSVDGTAHAYGSAPADYSTDVLAAHATDFIDNTPSGQPLFLYFAPYAPHGPTVAPPRYKHACPGLPPIRRPDFNEADVSDKPHYVSKHALLTPNEIAKYDRRHKKDCRALLGADDAVGNIVDALQANGRLSNTLLVFMSDNGYLLGEHRRSGKIVPYEESIRVPMIVRYDPITSTEQGTTDDNLVLNMDLAPTFAAAGGTTAPGAEGMNLLPLLADPGTPWRSEFLVEHWGEGGVPVFCGLRTTQYKFVEYDKQGGELYDLAADPYELQNQASNAAYAAIKAQLHDDLVTLCSPPPPGFTP
jgi:N-acetylglucosamine-6-sulfatase